MLFYHAIHHESVHEFVFDSHQLAGAAEARRAHMFCDPEVLGSKPRLATTFFLHFCHPKSTFQSDLCTFCRSGIHSTSYGFRMGKCIGFSEDSKRMQSNVVKEVFVYVSVTCVFTGGQVGTYMFNRIVDF